MRSSPEISICPNGREACQARYPGIEAALSALRERSGCWKAAPLSSPGSCWIWEQRSRFPHFPHFQPSLEKKPSSWLYSRFPQKAAAPGRSRSSLSSEQPRDAPSPFPPPQLCFFRLFPNKKQHHSCFPTSKELLSFRISSFNFAAGSGRCRCDGSTSLGSTLFGNFIPSSLPHSISLFPMAGVGAAGLYLIVNKVIAAPSQSKRVGIGLWIQHMGDGGACQGGKQHLILQGWPQHQSKAPRTPQSWFVRC